MTTVSQHTEVLDNLVAHYRRPENQSLLNLFRNQLLEAFNSSLKLPEHIHSIRSRIKNASHLRDKLQRKVSQCTRENTTFDISADNLNVKINDLIGIRILHLYTRQIKKIDEALREIFQEGQYGIVEGPFARTWDDESRKFFDECNISTQQSPSMYTSVHYIIGSNSRTKMTAEIQVRTLAEEVWGEVNHTINYPHSCDGIGCSEQLKVLARMTSSVSGLVDSIFLTHEEHRSSKAVQKAETQAAG